MSNDIPLQTLHHADEESHQSSQLDDCSIRQSFQAVETDVEAGVTPSHPRWGWTIFISSTKRFALELWGTTFPIRAIVIITVNFASSMAYILLVYTFTSTKDPTPPLLPSSSSPHPYLNAILLSWCATTVILIGYRIAYHEMHSQESYLYRVRIYATRLFLVGVGIYILVAFGLHKLGVNMLSGVLLSITLAVLFV